MRQGKKIRNLQSRKSGILLHISSLPSRHGIGDLGTEAYRFVDFLKESGQSWWQMFPIGPEGFGHSPYQTLSVFAGNSLLIGLDSVAKDGLLSTSEIKKGPRSSARINYKRAQRFKDRFLEKAFENFVRKQPKNLVHEFNQFLIENDNWLDPYSLYRALRWENKRKPWWNWPGGARSRKPSAIRQAKKRLAHKIQYFQFLQFLFFKQWNELKRYCHKKGVGIIGDAPIFVAEDSADVWWNPELFHLNKNGRPTIVAGVPPDYFSKTGQRWGNPIYKWNVHRKTGYRWWVKRLQMAFELFDAVRLDHFIGFQNYWAIPAKDLTAVGGRWEKGPGADFFKKILKKLGPVQFIAEDLGVVTKAVRDLRDQFHFPGMRVLQFSFGNNAGAKNFSPFNFPRNCVVYTGTHDNDTTVGWFKDKGFSFGNRGKVAMRKERELALKCLNSNGKQIHWDMIKAALKSQANTVIFPAQDLLGLGSEARMNRPGTSHGNWVWQLKKGQLNRRISKKLYSLTRSYGRIK